MAVISSFDKELFGKNRFLISLILNEIIQINDKFKKATTDFI